MEMSVSEESAPKPAETSNAQDCDSAENFQNFIYQLFEKNGILNDLRAYLRGHIVNVLKSAQTGSPPACQKYFTQRLDLKFQSLNILIAEYLMRLEFSYSFSVFISEIPLGNMVFEFAKNLMQYSHDENSNIRFSREDMCAIFNYLGIQCDSEHASDVMAAYASSELPLLLCILKGMPMYKKEPAQRRTLTDISTSSSNSLDSLGNKRSGHDKCKHYAFCRTCQSRISRIKDKYRKKKKCLAKNAYGSSGGSTLDVETLMRNINIMERSLIDEMFEQLKGVYEAEVEILKAEEDKRLKRSLLSHSTQLQRQQEEMEASFREREATLEQDVMQKKRFLWGLARTLRDQHARLAGAMRGLRAEARRLSHQEDSLKAQITEAEDALRKRAEDMRAQISSELTKLEEHLVSMKRERDSINEDRAQLERIRTKRDGDEMHAHHGLLKSELGVLKKFLEDSRQTPKCVVDRCTVTDISDVNSKLSVVLNNGQGVGSDVCNQPRNNHLVNDLKKKNVNVGPSKLDEIFRERSRSSLSSDGGEAFVADNEPCRGRNTDYNGDVAQRLTEENERLKTFARQQRDHIDELCSAQARLQAELTSIRFREVEAASLRPRTAPPVTPTQGRFAATVNNGASVDPVNLSWIKGAGEELSLFSNVQPRVLIPGDTVPFTGVLRDRNSDCRRHMVTHWRSLRRRTSPLGGVTKHKDRVMPSVNATVSNSPQTSHAVDNEDAKTADGIELLREPPNKPRTRTAVNSDIKVREKSPKSVLREAKEKLRMSGPGRSPCATVREAKGRLRRLQVEADAVHASYLDFRKRQSDLRNERKAIELTKIDPVAAKEGTSLELKIGTSTHEIDRNLKNEFESKYKDVANSFSADIDKYLKNYQNKFNLVESHFRSRITSAEIGKPIPDAYSPKHNKSKNSNLLETPLTEFRKLYSSDKQLKIKSPPKPAPDQANSANRMQAIKIVKGDKNAEFEILKQNINKIYNIPNNTERANECKDENLLKVEIESEMSVNSRQGVAVLVESVANVKVAETNIISNPMTIIISPKRSVIDNVEEVKAVEKSYNLNNNERYNVDGEATVSTDDGKDESNSKCEKDSKTNGKSHIPVSPRYLRKLSIKTESEEISVKSSNNPIISTSPQCQMDSVLLSNNSSKDQKPNNSPRSDITQLKSKKSPKDEEFVLTPNRPKRSLSPEQEAHLTRNDVLDAIFNDEIMDQKSSIGLASLEGGQTAESLSEIERGDDYGENFSADVDNYNSRSDVNEPISMPKTSEDENFWDS